MVETQRKDMVGCYPEAVADTPNMKRLVVCSHYMRHKVGIHGHKKDGSKYDLKEREKDNMKKRFLSTLLAIYMVFALLPPRVMAVASTTASPEEISNVGGMGGIRVAEIEGRGYSSLQNAVNDVQEGQTIKLMVASHTLSAAITIAADNETSFTFDLNGYSLSSTQGVISHKGSGTLTVTDSMHSQSAKLTTSAQSSDTIEILNDGILVLESGTIEHAGEGASFVGAIHGSGYGGIYIKGGTVRTALGYAIIAQFYTLVNITGGLVAAQNGTAIYVTGMGGVIVGGTATITSANADTGAGTIIMAHFDPLQTDVYLEITGGVVENTAQNGNALTNIGYGTAEISGGVIDGSGVNGTGVLVQNGSTRETIIIKKGTPVIKGRNGAINGIPLLRDDVQISAGLNYESDSLEDSSLSLLFPNNLHRVGPFYRYKYLRFRPTTAVAKISTKFYTDLQEAFNDGASGSTIYLVADTSLGQTVFNEKGRNFTLDLNGKLLSCPSGSVLFNAWGELTITDNSADKSGCINGDIKNGVSKLTIAGGTVYVSGSNANAISSVARSGPVVVTGGMVSASGTGTVAIKNDSGYAVRISGDAVISSESGWAITGRQGVVIEDGWPIIRGGGKALNTGAAPIFDSEKITVKASNFYEGTPTTSYDASQYYSYKYLEFAPTPIENPDEQGFPVLEENDDEQGLPIHEENDATQNGSGNSSITFWLSGDDLNDSVLLTAQPITGGESYTALLRLAGTGDILGIYDIPQQSGEQTVGGALYLCFDLGKQHAGQAFTLVQKKADGTFEYCYAAVDAGGKVKFGPVYELSPFMLVKGTPVYTPSYEVLEFPKTGDNGFSMWLIPLSLSGMCASLWLVHRRKKIGSQFAALNK